ncbi:MAG: AtpZ/AtpI family protein [Planctomycetota bacterium]
MTEPTSPLSSSRLKHIALGSELAGEVLVPVLLGLWVDTHFETSPTFVLLGTFLALALVTATLVRIVTSRSN